MRQGWRVSFNSDNERQERDAQPAGDKDCARGQFCSMATRERDADGKTARIPAKTSTAFCHRDDIVIGSCLRSLPDGYRLVTRMLGYRETSEVLVRVPYGPSVAIRVDLDELARLMTDMAMSWLERVAHVDSTLQDRDGGSTLPSTARWHEQAAGRGAVALLGQYVPVLAERVSALTVLAPEPMLRPGIVASLGCGSPLGPAGDTVLVEASGTDAGTEALRLGYLWRAALGLTPAVRDDLLGVDCEACGKRALRRSLPPMHDGDQAWHAECNDCGAVFTEQEFKSHSERMVRFYSRRITPAMLAFAGLRGTETRAIAEAVAASRAAA